MVFGDVSGFTKMSERLARHGKVGAEEVADAINACFEELLGVAYQCGGNLLKFGGDALLLLFTGEDHATRAAHAAVGHAGQAAGGRTDRHLRRPGGPPHLDRGPPGHLPYVHGGRVAPRAHRGRPAATSTVEAEGTATAGEIVMSTAMAASLRRSEQRTGPWGLVPPPGTPRAPPRCSPSRRRSSAVSTSPAMSRQRSGSTSWRGGASPSTAPRPSPSSTSTAPMPSSSEHGPDDLAERLHTVVRRVQVAAEENDVSFLGTDIDHDGGKIILVSGVPRRAGEDEQRMLLALRQISRRGAAPRPAHRCQHRTGVRR